MAEMNKNYITGCFELPLKISESGLTEKKLFTKDTYVNKDIDILITADKGELTITSDSEKAAISDNAKTYLTTTKTKFPIEYINGRINVGVEQGGFIGKNDYISIGTEDILPTTYIKEAEFRLEKTNGSASIGITSDSEKYLTNEVSPYPVTINSNKLAALIKAYEGGAVSEGDTIFIPNSGDISERTFYITPGKIKSEGSASITGYNGINLIPVDSEPIDGMYIKASAFGGANVESSG